MKIRLLASKQGNVLLGTMVASGLLGVAMASYLKLVSVEYSAANRSQGWNMAMPAAEAGVEEALTHMYYNCPSNILSEGWTPINGNAIFKQRLLREDADQREWYQVIIVGTNNPTIFSQGFVRLRAQTNDISRKVMITTQGDSLFSRAMVAKKQIDLNGSKVTVDSFDSADPNYCSNGAYDPAKRKDNGEVATNSGLINSLDVGNADIWGSIATGPGGTVAIGPTGAVGDATWHALGTNGVQSGHCASDMNVAFHDVKVPFTEGAFPLTPQRIETETGTENVYILDRSVNWKLDRGLDYSLVVKTNVHATLLVTDSFKFTAKQYIKIEPGASLKFYMQGASADIGGLGIFNENGNADSFFYLGLPGNTGLSVKGNGEFTGVIYAPNAAFTLSGGGKAIEDFVGASVTSTVTMNGHFNFHYDENLGRLYKNRGYIVTSWQEL